MKRPKYKDASQSITVRVKDLLARMTIQEKIAQMSGIWLRTEKFMKNGDFCLEKLTPTIRNGIGQITRIAGSFDYSPVKVAEVANQIQEFLCEETRLGIPAIVHEECLSGLMAKGATNFPQAINLGSTWNPELIEQVTGVIRRQMRAVGAHQGLAPVVDVARDARWGRVEETFGEDPYLVSRMAVVYVRGLQGENIATGVMATLKHFAGYAFSEGGRNAAPVHLGKRELYDIFLFPFKVAIKEAHACAIMNAYHDIDGIPCSASYELLTRILRKEWGFEGLVVSDYGSIEMLHNFHFIAADYKEAAISGVNAGIDIELPNPVCYAEPLLQAIKEGRVSTSRIDEIVSRILTWKFNLGLFENPYVDPAIVTAKIDTAEDRALALQVARESIILLKNENQLLPLSKSIKSIALIGPSADSGRNLIGDYGYTAHLACDTSAVPIISIRQGLLEKIKQQKLKIKVHYARGCDILDKSRSGFKEAVLAARKSEVAIVVVGGKSGFTANDTCGEGRDRDTLELPGVQEELVKAIYETDTPVIVVLINGRPQTIEWISENIPAIVEAWLPGEEGGTAVADVLFGDYNPGGKLTVTFPRRAGQEPFYYNHKHSTYKDYVESSLKPLFPFGHGLSYTRFEYGDLKIKPVRVRADGEINISFTIKNSGEKRGDEVCQLYIRDKFASVTRPVKELKGFKRLTLEPGEKRTVKYILSADQLAFHNLDMKLVIEPGEYEVMIGSSSADIRLAGKFEIVGTMREIKNERHFSTKVKVI